MTNYLKAKLYQLYSYLIYIVPLVILVACNFSKYLKVPSYRLSLTGYMVLIFLLVGFKSKFADFAKKNTVLTVSLVIFVISLVMRYLADELLLLSTVSLIGAVLSSVIEPVTDVYLAHAYTDIERRIKSEERALPDKTAWKLAYGFLTVKKNNPEDKDK